MSIVKKVFAKANASLIKKTNGRLGTQLTKQSVLVLHTVGRKSGKAYATPLSYYLDGENYLIVASNWGKEESPEWFRNLMHHPRTTIQVKDKTFEVEARQAEDGEYQHLWQVVTRKNSQFLEYQKGLTRRIPVVILNPVQ
ncbi:MAG: nitroreductase family deazaflavin-dependent oxidoreductase [Chloroflexi bacterium]|nr:nitroreductase family deazaflavin-dependent oxidoreductase [Chloroflexota bacterium]